MLVCRIHTESECSSHILLLVQHTRKVAMASKSWDIFKASGRFTSDSEEVMCMWDDIPTDNGTTTDEESDSDFDAENYEECDFVNESETTNTVPEMHLKGLEDSIAQSESNAETGENASG